MSKTVYIQFTAGRGPTECSVACQEVFKRFRDEYIDNTYFTFKVVSYEEDYTEGFKSIIIEFKSSSDSELENVRKKWEGTIRYIATKNHIRPNHKRKNWYVGVNFFEVVEPTYTSDGDNINPKDLKWETMRSSGPGGQHVNKTESAVRVTHIPTGISVRCDEYRDQSKNRELAYKILLSKLRMLEKSEKDKQKNQVWQNHDQLERGNEVMIIKGEI